MNRTWENFAPAAGIRFTSNPLRAAAALFLGVRALVRVAKLVARGSLCFREGADVAATKAHLAAAHTPNQASEGQRRLPNEQASRR
jgi:hypothetical protein